MIDQKLVQGSDAWKAHRRNCVTATDIAKIIGINQYCTALKLWNQKLGIEPEERENEAMRRGSELEPIALARFIKEIGIKMIPAVKFHPMDAWKMASLDGISECGKYAVEIKCSRAIFESARDGYIAPMYKSQMNWQMYILGIQKMYFEAWWDDDCIIIEFERDDDFLNEIMPKIHEFYNSMMEFTPPPATDKDYEISEDKELIFKLQVLQKLKQQKKDLDSQIDDLEDSIIVDCKGKSTIAGNLKFTKHTRRGSVDYSRIEILKSVDLDAYRKPSTQYFRISENG